MKDCCRAEAARHVRKHRDVAVCDACGRLVLGYGDEADYRKTLAELDRTGNVYETERVGVLWIVAKARTGA